MRERLASIITLPARDRFVAGRPAYPRRPSRKDHPREGICVEVGTITNRDPSSDIDSQPVRQAHAPIVAEHDQTPSAAVKPLGGAERFWLAFRQLTKLGFPRRFPLVQFPNAPLIVGLLAGAVATRLSGGGHAYLQSVSYVAITIWAYEELVHGVNWFRRLLGVAYVIILIVRIAHALQA
jgi:hypothetical protein